MKKINLLGLLIFGSVFGQEAVAQVINNPPMPTVTLKGGGINLTYPADTATGCISDIQNSVGHACTPGNCSISSGTTLKFRKCTSITLTFQSGSGCKNTQAEFRLSPYGTTYDISLVNGFSKPVSIGGGGTPITVNSLADGKKAGVYPYGCTECTALGNTPCHPLGATCHKGSQYNPKVKCQIDNDGSKAYTVSFGG